MFTGRRLARGLLAAVVALPLIAFPAPVGAVTLRPPYYRPVYVPPPPPPPPVDYRAPIRAAISADLELAGNTREQVGDAYNASLAEQAALRAQADGGGPARAEARAVDLRVARHQAAADRLTAAAAALDSVVARLGSQRDSLASTEVPAAQAGVESSGRDLQAATSAAVQAMFAEAAAALPPRQGDLRLAWPEDNFSITQGWGPSDLAGEPPFGGVAHFHLGYDLAAPEGTPVRAAAEGVVVLVGQPTAWGRFMGFGNYVVVLHQDGVDTLYGHLAEITAHPGDRVGPGTELGLEGSTGYSTGPHLHFETHVNGVPVDSTPMLPKVG